MSNINLCGETAVHMGSKGKLTTSDTCMTPSHCVPITYTNLAESLMADQTAKSVKICGNPACNQDSIFKISQGDAPGCCGGVASGSVGQMTKFIEGLSNVSIGGVAAVCNGLLKTSNADNTDPQPLVQPPAGKAPANTAEAPVAEKEEFSQQFDFSALIGYAPDEVEGKKELLETPNYKITDQEGTFSYSGTLSKQGLTQRIYSPEKKPLIAWLGEGEWVAQGDHDHGSPESEEESKDTTTVEFEFVNFALAGIPDMDYKFQVDGKEITGKTDAEGAAKALTGIKPDSAIEISVLSKTLKGFRKIATVYAGSGDSQYLIISPKIRIESATEKHLDKTAKPAAAPAGAQTATHQKVETQATRDKDGHPLLLVKRANPDQPCFSVYQYWTMQAFAANVGKIDFTKPRSENDLCHPRLHAHPQVNPANAASMAPEGTALSEDNLDKLQTLIAFTESHIKLLYKAETKKVINKYTETETRIGGNPGFAQKASTGKKAFTGYCLRYVKVALMRTKYITGTPPAGDANQSGSDWINFGYKEIGSKLPKVSITYEKAYEEEDLPQVNEALDKEHRVKVLELDQKTQKADQATLEAQLATLKAKLATINASPVTKDTKKNKQDTEDKITQKNKKIEAKKTEIEKTGKDLAKAKKDNEKAQKDLPAKGTPVFEQPDLMYTLPGDLIVYEKVDTIKYKDSGHIDIRTYHGFISDAAWGNLPSLGRKPPTSHRYRVIGVYRKISDTMAMVRVQAFLRIIREYVAGETSLSEKDRSYQLKQYDKNAKDPFADKNTELKTHPSNKDENKSAGAYQIKFRVWRDIHTATGWPETFDSKMQDRLAMYLLQARPIKEMQHPRRSALGYIMENEVEKAVTETGLTTLFSFLPGGGNEQQLTMDELKEKFNDYVIEASK